jgi:hypothetical protein
MTLEEQAATLRSPEILALLVQQRELQEQNAALKRQVEWFQRQLFGRKSEGSAILVMLYENQVAEKP